MAALTRNPYLRLIDTIVDLVKEAIRSMCGRKPSDRCIQVLARLQRA